MTKAPWPGLLQHWRRHREQTAIQRRAIPDGLWKRTLVRFPFLQRRDDPGASELRRLTSLFLDRKEFTVVGELRLSDAIAVSIAAQAVLPVLRLGVDRYDGFVGVVVHADQVIARREQTDDDGIVHEYDEVLAGEAVHNGPVMLSWRDVRAAGTDAVERAYNVVIHEFAHVLDLADGRADGVPLLPPDWPHAQWQAGLAASFERFQTRLQGEQPTVIDTYGAEAVDEFFAVATESFFVSPRALQMEDGALYGQLSRFYKQDPAAEQPDRKHRA